MFFSGSVLIFFIVQGSTFGFYHPHQNLDARILFRPGLFQSSSSSTSPISLFQSIADSSFLKVNSRIKSLETKFNTLNSLSSTVAAASTLISQVAEAQRETQDDLEALETEVAALKASVDPLVNPAASKKR